MSSNYRQNGALRPANDANRFKCARVDVQSESYEPKSLSVDADAAEPIKVNSEGVPGELKSRSQWVTWRWEVRKGKSTKVPLNPITGRHAKPDDPRTWTSYEAALADYKKNGRAGIGYVFSADDPYCGIDLDACLNPETGELTDWARPIVDELDSYTEISPSGFGVKLIVRAKLPPGHNQKKLHNVRRFGPKAPEIALYDKVRYWCLTGRQLPSTSAKIEERQVQLDDLVNKLWPRTSVPKKSVKCPARGRLFARLVHTCESSENGYRSEAIFNLLCAAHRHGWDREMIWERVGHVGKFAERGRLFFDAEWARAAQKVEHSESPRRSRYAAPTDAKRGSASPNLPEVQLPGGDMTITSAAGKFGDLLGGTGRFYVRGGLPIRLVETNYDRKLEVIRPAALCSDLETVSQLVAITRTKDGEAISPTICSESNARRILESFALRSALPEIRVLSECPVLIERDSVLAEITGYDRESGILADGSATPSLSLDEAVALLQNLLLDFRFATPGDAARGMAGFITPALVFGGLLGSRAPVDLGEADKSQTGKGYRNKLTAAIYRSKLGTVTQREGGVGSMQETFDDKLVSGVPFISLDNFRGKQDLPWLESFLTEDNYSARVPYRGSMAIDTRRIIVMLTSNAAETTRDLANRSSCVRILKQPSDYQFKRYPEGELLDHVVANQSQFLGAVFSVIRRWHELGKPELSIVDHDFRRWARVLGYIVEKILEIGPLLDGHRAAQERISSPGLTWLREVALAVQQASHLDRWLRPHQLLEILVDAGLEDATDEEEKWLVATQALGRKLGRCFRSDSVTIDVFRIERTKSDDSEGRKKREYAFFSNSPNSPNTSPNENLYSPNSPNGS